MPDAIHDEALERRHRDPIGCGDGHVVEHEPERVQSGQARRAAARQRAERPLLPMGKEARRRGEQLHAAPVQAERRLPAACNEEDHQLQSESEAIIRFGAPPATSIAPSALKYSADKPCGPATSLLPPTTAPSSSAPSAPSSSSSLLAAWSAVVGGETGPSDAVPTMAPAQQRPRRRRGEQPRQTARAAHQDRLPLQNRLNRHPTVRRVPHVRESAARPAAPHSRAGPR
jgi:hypothetical protein